MESFRQLLPASTESAQIEHNYVWAVQRYVGRMWIYMRTLSPCLPYRHTYLGVLSVVAEPSLASHVRMIILLAYC